jgi:glycosyltransferase involved in cell wall biosynthesis
VIAAAEHVTELEILVDGVGHRAERLPTGEFWLTVSLSPRTPAAKITFQALIGVRDGTQRQVELGLVEVVEPAAAPSYAGARGPDTIAICMATFEPDIALFRAQVDSLRGQSDERWVCLISDDCSAPERFEQIVATIDSDPRFVLSRSERRLGFYRNFERALRMVPAEVELIALADQDDRWDPDKLATLRAALGDARLVYCDQRLVDYDGRVLRETLWKGRRNNHTNLASLLIANTITGAATLFRRDVARLALPFPESPGYQFHDQWIGLAALALGNIAYVPRPLYDYVQHGAAVFGDVTHGANSPKTTEQHPVPERLRASYFYGYLSRALQAQTLLARTGDRMPVAKRRALGWFLASERSLTAFAWLLARPVRCLVGRNETLGTELELAKGIVWRTAAKRWPRLASRSGAAGPPQLAAFNESRLRRWRASI